MFLFVKVYEISSNQRPGQTAGLLNCIALEKRVVVLMAKTIRFGVVKTFI